MTPPPFPALSVRQPWADLILSGHKDIENRTWRSNFRGLLLIHAPQTVDTPAITRFLSELGLRSAAEYHPVIGAILGITHVTDCVSWHPSRWFQGPFGLVLQRSKRLPTPIPFRGKLGIFPVPAEVLAGVEMQVRD